MQACRAETLQNAVADGTQQQVATLGCVSTMTLMIFAALKRWLCMQDALLNSWEL